MEREQFGRPPPVEMSNGQTIDQDKAEDHEKRRLEFAIRVIELADAFDSLDHEYAFGGTELQDDCMAVRDFIRKTISPRRDNAVLNE